MPARKYSIDGLRRGYPEVIQDEWEHIHGPDGSRHWNVRREQASHVSGVSAPMTRPMLREFPCVAQVVSGRGEYDDIACSLRPKQLQELGGHIGIGSVIGNLEPIAFVARR